ncbi:hypothetical protein [Campylobacter sp.]|nr:hypothetical protein [Campylobacter sp.]
MRGDFCSRVPVARLSHAEDKIINSPRCLAIKSLRKMSLRKMSL